MGLRDTIERLAAEAQGSTHPIKPTPEIMQGWGMAVGQLYRQIEAYLIDYLLKGQMRFALRVERQFASNVGPTDATLLDIEVGSRVVHLVPRFDLQPGRIGTVTMADHQDGPEIVFVFTDTGSTYDWTVRAPERGMRRMLASYLPEKMVPLDEALFKATLDEALIGRQPMVTYDPQVVRERLAVLLDHVTTAEIDVRLTRLAAERWVPELKSRGSLVASSLKASAESVRTRVQGPRPLLLGQVRHDGPDPADQHRDGGSGEAPTDQDGAPTRGRP